MLFEKKRQNVFVEQGIGANTVLHDFQFNKSFLITYVKIIIKCSLRI